MPFCAEVLPSTGPYLSAIPFTYIDKKDNQEKESFRHREFYSIDDLEAFLHTRDEQGDTVYFALGSFDGTLKNNGQPARAQKHVNMVRSFWLDIDCGIGKNGKPKPYPNQQAGAKALVSFCTDMDLPMPTVVNSGTGLYAYWRLTNDVPAQQWTAVAKVLKQATALYNFEVDQSRTADSASVLRPVGAHNRKNACNVCSATVELIGGPCAVEGCTGKGYKVERPITVGTIQPPVDLATFAAKVDAGVRKKGGASNIFDKPKAKAVDANSDLFDFTDNQAPTADALQIAAKCAQIAHFKGSAGNIEEPLWYAGIQLLRFTIQAPDIIHEWSSGHPNYNASDTNEKIAQLEEKAVGPTTCVHFGDKNPKGCVGCLHKDKITSPIQLGRVAPEAVELTDGEIAPPRPFIRTKEGIFAQFGDEELVHVYNHDLFVSRMAYDESLGYATINIHHHLPQDGWGQFDIRAGLIHDKKQFIMALNDNGVIVGGGNREKTLMLSYIEGYQKEIQKRRRMTKLFSQMGWKEKPDGHHDFVLGKMIFHRDGTVEEAALAKNIPPAAMAFKAVGSLEEWIKATEVFQLPGTEGLAFAFLAGAFGAPLMQFTGFEGGLVSLIGQSGVGKSLVSRFLQSTYGEPSQLMMLRDDTKNSLISRLGVYGSLPLTVDEVTNMAPEECSDLAYRVTQGRDKARMHRSGVERTAINHWKTVAVISSNHSFVAKLSAAKADASAEINRVFEYTVNPSAAFTRDIATACHRTFMENYGHAGQVYVRYLVQHYEKHQANLDVIIKELDRRSGAAPEERFWSAMAGSAIYGGAIAKQLGIINFDVSGVMQWAADTIANMRDTKSSYITDSISLLGDYFAQNNGNALIVTNTDGGPRSLCTVRSHPRGSLHHRIEADRMMAYISRDALRHHLYKKQGDLSDLLRDLDGLGALKDARKRKVLGSGTDYASSAQMCIVVDLGVPALGNISAKAVELPRAKADEVDDMLREA